MSDWIDTAWSFLNQPRTYIVWRVLNSPFVVSVVGGGMALYITQAYQRRHANTELRRSILLQFNDVFSKIIVETSAATRGFPARRREEDGARIAAPMVVGLDTDFFALYRQLMGMFVQLDFFANGARLAPIYNRMINALEGATQIPRDQLDVLMLTRDGFPNFISNQLAAASDAFADFNYMMAREVTPLTIWDRIQFWRHKPARR